MANAPNFGWILLAQSLSAGGELFGQRSGRKLHKNSNIRSAISVVIYSAIQAFLILLILELALPHHVTKGQGSLGMWKLLYQHPGLWLNAFNNTIYWIALIYVLREPLGVVMVVIAFLLATFFINPFSALVHLDQPNTIDVLSVTLGLLGALCCLINLPIHFANRFMPYKFRWRTEHVEDEETALTKEGRKEDLRNNEQRYMSVETDALLPEDIDMGHSFTDISLDTEEDQDISKTYPNPSNPSYHLSTSHVAVGIAFSILAVTAGIGIVITDYFEEEAGLNMFGYAAVDQVLLPFTTLPVLWLCHRYNFLARFIGEPIQERQTKPSWSKLLLQTWHETKFTTLIPFRGLMFAREFVFFYLVTKFDIDSTYLQMTLVRIILCWIASILACTLLRKWVGVHSSETHTVLHPINIALKIIGTAIVIISIMRLTGRL